MYRRACAVLFLLLVRCGAGDTNADNPDPNPPTCPTIEEIAPNFLRMLRADDFAGLREVLESDLGKPLDPTDPTGPTRLNALIGVLVDVIKAVDVPGFRQVLLDALRSTNAGPLLPQALGLLKYIDGEIGCPTGTTCDHYDLLDVLRNLLFAGVCTESAYGFDAKTELNLLIRLVEYPRLPELLDLLPRLLQNPTFQGVIDNFQFMGCDTPPCEQENGFAALLDIVLNNLLVSPIPWNQIRDVLHQVRLDTPEVVTLLGIAQDLLTEQPATPDADILTPMRAAIRCLRHVDPGRRLGRDLYQILALDEVSLDGLLGGVDRLLQADPQHLTLKLLAQALGYFRNQALSSWTTVQVVADVLFSPDDMRKIIPSLIAMIEGNVVPELVNLLVALTDDCTTLNR
jgi:hypothetical protein